MHYEGGAEQMVTTAVSLHLAHAEQWRVEKRGCWLCH